MFLLYYDAQSVLPGPAAEAAKGFGLLRHRNAHFWESSGCPYKGVAHAAENGCEGVVILECEHGAAIADAFAAIGLEVHRREAPDRYDGQGLEPEVEPDRAHSLPSPETIVGVEEGRPDASADGEKVGGFEVEPSE